MTMADDDKSRGGEETRAHPAIEASQLITDWHPLDGVAAPDYVPEQWDGPQVGKRLIEALRILRRMPMPPGPRQYGNGWPSYQHSWEDVLAQYADEAERAVVERAQNRVKLLPTAEEIARTEMAVAWPARYLKYFPQLLMVVQAVAAARARYRQIERVSIKLGLPERIIRLWNREGLDIIARGLIDDQVRVF